KEYVPAISSMKTFIESPDFLGDLKLHISVPSAMEIKEIQPIEKLKMVERFFSYMEKKIRSNYMKERGTPVFEGVSLSKLINNFINDYIDKLKEIYTNVYLIRNERKVKIVEIDGTRGFMPDFLLYLQDELCTYQIFLEPKGDHLRQQDKWKEDFLASLSERDD